MIRSANHPALLALLLASEAALAAPQASRKAAAESQADVPASNPIRRVEWRDDWARFRAWEYAYTPIALGTGFYLRFGAETKDANWRGGILFDDAVLDAVALDGREANEAGQVAADAFFYGTFVYRLVDSTGVPLVAYGNADLALQMSMIDLEAFGTVALVLWGSQTIVRRERPVITRRCDEPEFAGGSSKCAPESVERSRSFIAGHFATVLTGAGLTCIHHAHIPLYGAGWDDVACGTMVGAAGMTAALRIVTEDHYPTDVILGFLLGGFSGWVLPTVLHYDAKPKNIRAENPSAVSMQLLPWAQQDRIGVAATGAF